MNDPETPFGEVVYYVTIVMSGAFFVVAAAAVILSFVFRKIGKVKASIWANVIALLYIIVVFGVNTLAAELL